MPRSITTPPHAGRDADPSQGYPPAACHRYPFTHLGEERQSGRVVTNITDFSCQVNTTSGRGIEQLGISFGSIFLWK